MKSMQIPRPATVVREEVNQKAMQQVQACERIGDFEILDRNAESFLDFILNNVLKSKKANDSNWIRIKTIDLPLYLQRDFLVEVEKLQLYKMIRKNRVSLELIEIILDKSALKYFQDKESFKKGLGASKQMNYIELSPQGEELLQEILTLKKRKNDKSAYWHNRFDELSFDEDSLLRNVFKELKECGYIETQWADNIPYILTVTVDGTNYFNNKKKAFNASVSAKIEQSRKQYDVFISHANKDKLDYVDSLHLTLKKLGINIFYDSEVLSWGDNWKQVILEGTEKSEFAIIVISEQFFGREWTEKELDEFLTRQNESGQKIILPLLHNISIDELKRHYPDLGDIQSIKSESYDADGIAILLAKELIKRYK